MSSSSITNEHVDRLDRWWVTALVAASLVAMVVTMVRLWPTATATCIAGVAISVFCIVLYLNPRHWLKRRSATCLGIAGAAAAMPSISGLVNLPEGWLAISTGASPWVAAVFGVLALGFAYLDRERGARGGAKVKISSTTHGPNSPGVVFGPVTYQQGVDPEIVKKMLERHEREVEHLRGQLSQSQLSPNEVRLLGAAVARVEREAMGGNEAARDAITQARASGDAGKLFEVLKLGADAIAHQMRASTFDYIELCREIAVVAFVRGDYDEAARRLEIILRVLPNDLDALNRVGHIHYSRGELDAAEQRYRRVEQIAAEHGSESWRTTAVGNLANIMMTRGDLEGAEQSCRAALESAIRRGDDKHVAHGYFMLGNLSVAREQFVDAEPHYRKSLEVSEKLNWKPGVAQCYGSLGIVMTFLGDLDGAERMCRKSLQMAEEMGRVGEVIINYGNLGNILMQREKYEEAESMYGKALSEAQKLGSLDLIATGCANVGCAMAAQLRFSDARAIWVKARQLFAQLGAQSRALQVQQRIDDLDRDIQELWKKLK